MMAMLGWVVVVGLLSAVGVMSLPMPFGVERDCNIANFKLQDDFSLERYMGTWYVIEHIQKTDYPFQKRSHYGLREDGSISMRTERIVRPGDCNAWEFEATGTPNDDDVDPAKLYLYPPMPGYIPDDYWVVSTDYTSYALVYSCGRQRSNGSCTQRGQRAWLIARSAHPLPTDTRAHVLEKLWTVCVNPERLRDVPLECEVPLTQDDEPLKMPDSTDCLNDKQGNCSKEGEQTNSQEVADDSEDSSKHNPCEISTFKLQSNFTVEKFLGEWYEIAHSRAPGSALRLPDMRSMMFSPAVDDSQADMDLMMKDIKLGGQCVNMDTPGSGWISQRHPAKFIVHFPIPEKYGVSGPVEYWILGTDYSNYAVTYSCHEVNEDGTCDQQREALWVLSRTLNLPRNVQAQVDQAIQGVCMDHLRLVENQDVCNTTAFKETNETQVVIKGKAAVTTGCDPATAKYGCCLLNNRPAMGPDYQGCPRMRPPVAGQSLEMRPVSEVVRPAPVALAQMAPASLKVKEVECDEKIICKIYCDYGFKKDEDGCDICQCAEEPTETATDPPLREAGSKNKLVSCLHQTPSKLGLPLLDCEQDGRFARVQCHGGECWCVDQTTGYEVKGTRASHDEKPDCTQIPKASKWNHKASKISSDCLARRLEAETSWNLSEGSGQFHLPVCDKRGLYEQVQCYVESDLCWCVDPWSGVQMEGSIVQGRPQCSP